MIAKTLKQKEVIKMAEQKVPKGFCGCGCLPVKQKEVKTTVPTKAEKEERKEQK